MNRIIKLSAFAILSALLVWMSIFFVNEDSRLIASSKATMEKYGGLWQDGEGRLISLYAYHGEKAFLENMKPVTKLGADSPLPVYLAIPPMKMDVLDIPSDIDKTPFTALFDLAQRECGKHGVTYIDLLSVMEGENLYFSTDHHWTSHGAYLAYCEVVKAMGITPVEEGYFRQETAHTQYRGSDWGKSEKSPDYTVYDSIVLYYSEGYDEYMTTIVNHPYDTEENNLVTKGMYNMEKLNSWDPYTVYFGGNTPYVTVRNGEDRETLMLIRDSFASSLAPFLAEHFDLVLIDPRFYPERLSRAVEREGADAILVLENMGSFTENTIKITY